MPSPVIGELKRRVCHTRASSVVYVAMLLLSLHWALVVYVNSTYLSGFVSDEAIGALFTIGAALSVLSFLFISRVLRRVGNYYLTMGLVGAELIALIGMGFSQELRIVIPLFILHQAVVPLLLFNIDVFMEEKIGNKEQQTGGSRGLLLTTMSLAGALGPLGAGILLGSESLRFPLVYSASALVLLLFGYIIHRNYKTFHDPTYREVRVLSSIHHFWKVRDIRFVFLAHFLLQLFFAWSVIYVPLYLATEVGITWDNIGLILFVGLLAYVFLEYPIGKIADLKLGEKEMMAAGFIILVLSVSWISFTETAALVPWMLVMFMTRVGASLIEATSESYFFKHTKGSDANVISFFRITRPLAIIAGSLLGSLSLLYLPFGLIFIVLSLALIPGLLFATMIKDTR